MKCLMCDKEFDGDSDSYQFCDDCVDKLELLHIDLTTAEIILSARKKNIELNTY